MAQCKFKNRIAVLVLLMATTITAGAVQDHGPTPLTLPDWIKLSLTAPTILKEIYSNSIAESVFIKLKRETFLPPVQYLTRPSTTDNKALSREILSSLGVNLNSKTTILM